VTSSTKNIESLLGGKILVISPKDTSTVVPLFCSVCEFPMKTIEDSIAFRKCGTCSHCDGRWTNDKRVSWSEGKFPDKSWDDWKEYITLRAIYAKLLITFK